MPYRLVIFDFDGTLADSAPWLRDMLREVAQRYGFRAADDDELEELRGKSARAGLAQLGVPLWKLPLIARHVRSRMAQDIATIRPFPFVSHLLEQLEANGVLVAIVTSNAEANVRAVLGLESAARVSYYACGAGIFDKRSKFRAVLRASGVPSDAVIAIGDEVRDIEAAHAEGMAAGAVGWGYATPTALRALQPTKYFADAEELLACLV